MVAAVETMAYAGEVPWHGLGKKVLPDLTPQQMMQEAGVDWRVIECDTFVEFEDERVPTGQKALVRETDRRVLTQVGPNWNPVQNEEAFDFFHDFVMEGDMEMHTAGSLKDGEIVWALAKVKDDFTLFKGDTVESFLLFSNPHQYGKTIDIRFTPIRVVCNNTLTASLKLAAKHQAKINHRKAFDADEVKETLGLAHTKLDNYKEMAQFLGSKRYKDQTLDEFIMDVFGVKTGTENELTRTGEHVKELVTTQPGAQYGEGTWWQPFNAVTYYLDHEAGRAADTRMESAWFGANQKKKMAALDKAMEYAEAA